MTPEYKASVEASKAKIAANLANAMTSLEQALVIATDAGQSDDDLTPLYKALAATMLVKIKARNEVAA